MSKQTYNLTIENGQTVNENGFFFQASPFTIKTPETEFQIDFLKVKSGKVRFQISETNTPFMELDSPFYTPNNTPETLNGELKSPNGNSLKPVFAFFAKHNISMQTDYINYFKDESNTSDLSYSAVQNDLFD